jgi:hypothetical protein
MKIDFYKINDQDLASYYYFFDKINENNLIELNGYRIRNILSIVFNQNIKNYIINDLFNHEGKLLSSETKNELFRNISEEERNDLKSFLLAYLEIQINSAWLKNINQVIQENQLNIILLPSFVKNDVFLSSEFNRLFPDKKLVDWSGFDISKKALIIDYNHSWSRKNIFMIKNCDSKSFFLKHFFENVYQWKIYSEEKNLYLLFNTPSRQFLFGNEILDELTVQLEKLKPEKKKNEQYKFFDSEHKNSFSAQDELVLHFNNSKHTKYPMSASFLLKKGIKFEIVTAWDLVNSNNKYEDQFCACNIENLISKIDLSKLKVEIEKKNEMASSVDNLWIKHNLNPANGKLWKQLLFLKSKEVGGENLFNEIKCLLNNSSFVSLNTFLNTYCNPSNPTITPREKKVFRIICRYLDLPIEYMLAIQRERNLTGENSQERNIYLKNWLKAMVDIDLLDTSDSSAFLEKLNSNLCLICDIFDLEYFGLTEETLVIACKEFVDEILLKMNCNKIDRIEYIILN